MQTAVFRHQFNQCMEKRARYKTIADAIVNRPDIVTLLDGTGPIEELFDLPSQLSNERISLYKRIYEGIGNTPTYAVNLPNNNLLRIKMECANPMGNNHYSRCWIPYLFIGEVLEVIVPGQSHLIEVSSGSAGIALSMASQMLGYALTLIIPNELPVGRTRPMQVFGAELIRVPGYIDRCVQLLKRLLVSNKYFPCNHSEEMADILVKIDKRIMFEYCDIYGGPDYSIVGLGNGTSTYALFNYLKTHYPGGKRITYHPDTTQKDLVFGLYGPGVELRHIDAALSFTDERILTRPGVPQQMALKYKYDTEVSNLGWSSLFALGIALEKAQDVYGKTFFTIGYDKKDRYE